MFLLQHRKHKSFRLLLLLHGWLALAERKFLNKRFWWNLFSYFNGIQKSSFSEVFVPQVAKSCLSNQFNSTKSYALVNFLYNLKQAFSIFRSTELCLSKSLVNLYVGMSSLAYNVQCVTKSDRLSRSYLNFPRRPWLTRIVVTHFLLLRFWINIQL